MNLFFGSAFDLLQNPQVKLAITYENVRGRRTRKEVILDIKQFEGFSSAGTRPEDEMADALKKIERHLGQWSSGFQKLKVVSGRPQDWRDEDERENRYWGERARADAKRDGQQA